MYSVPLHMLHQIVVEAFCWGPSASEGPQKRNLIMSSKKNI
jgi:hypothetical protein